MNEIKKFYLITKDFGLKNSLLQAGESIFTKLNMNILAHYFHQKKYNYVEEYIRQNYSDIIEKYKKLKDTPTSVIGAKSPIWFFWWQGIDNAPEVVRICYKQLLKAIGKKRNIIVVSQKNFRKYTDLPEYIVKKVKNGQISFTHFSDILRVNLLKNQGGIWMDATIYITECPDLDEYQFYTVRHGLYSNWHVCRGLWSSFFMASGKGNSLFSFCNDIFFKYLKNENTLISYLFIDAVIAVGYDEIPEFKNMIDSVPKNNSKVFELQANLNKVYDSNDILLPSEINKLSYKEKLYKSLDNRITYYGKLSS